MNTRILSLKIGLYHDHKNTLYAVDSVVNAEKEADIVIDAWRKIVSVFKRLPGGCITEAIVYDHYLGRGNSTKKTDLMKEGE